MSLRFRQAAREDLSHIVRMLADDELGALRETVADPVPDFYARAFDAIDRDPNNELIVADRDGQLVGVLQLTFIPYLTHRGGWRALIEGVRVASAARSEGIGGQLIEWAIARSRERGCRIVQLTSDKRRADAIRFYERLGFKATHEGFKLPL